MPRSFNVLSLDGGGVRGAVEAVLLERIQAVHENFFRDLDLVVGVSTGAIQALALAAGKTPPVIRDMYEKASKFIFADSFLDDFRDGWKLAGADYSNKNLRKMLELQFGDMKLRDLDKKVAIVTFDLDNEVTDGKRPRSWKPKVFHNFPGDDSDGEELVVDVAMRSSAAPTYFPTYQGYCDGGVSANNPAMIGLAQALDPRTAKMQVDEVRVLSIGAGQIERFVKGNNHDWGVAQWAPKLLYMMMEGSIEIANFQCKVILKERFHRVNPVLKGTFSLDNWEKIPELVEAATFHDLVPTVKWLKEYWK
jgi:patatin-like phospholipase/acyl hydrolase